MRRRGNQTRDDIHRLMGPWTLALAQKDTQRDIKIHKIPRDVTEHGEREADSLGTEEIIKRCKPF